VLGGPAEQFLGLGIEFVKKLIDRQRHNTLPIIA
jgi:hypothetical protein